MLSLEKYLTKYSTINNNFIHDFFALQNTKTTTSDYTIYFHKVAKWLKVLKANLKRLLLNNFILNADYITVNKKSTGGRPFEMILLTSDCFKELAMLSKTKRAKLVRQYYISLEKHIDKYKSYIINTLDDRIGVLENNQKPKYNIKGGVIYIYEYNEYLKIGKAKNINTRLQTHNTSHADNVNVILEYKTNDIDAVESCLKTLLKSVQYRSRKEFYKIDMNCLNRACVSSFVLQLLINYFGKTNQFSYISI